MKVGDLVKGKLWGEFGIVVCVPTMPSMIEVCWTGEKPRRQKHLSGELEVLNEKYEPHEFDDLVVITY